MELQEAAGVVASTSRLNAELQATLNSAGGKRTSSRESAFGPKVSLRQPKDQSRSSSKNALSLPASADSGTYSHGLGGSKFKPDKRDDHLTLHLAQNEGDNAVSEAAERARRRATRVAASIAPTRPDGEDSPGQSAPSSPSPSSPSSSPERPRFRRKKTTLGAFESMAKAINGGGFVSHLFDRHSGFAGGDLATQSETKRIWATISREKLYTLVQQQITDPVPVSPSASSKPRPLSANFRPGENAFKRRARELCHFERELVIARRKLSHWIIMRSLLHNDKVWWRDETVDERQARLEGFWPEFHQISRKGHRRAPDHRHLVPDPPEEANSMPLGSTKIGWGKKLPDAMSPSKKKDMEKPSLAFKVSRKGYKFFEQTLFPGSLKGLEDAGHTGRSCELPRLTGPKGKANREREDLMQLSPLMVPRPLQQMLHQSSSLPNLSQTGGSWFSSSSREGSQRPPRTRPTSRDVEPVEITPAFADDPWLDIKRDAAQKNVDSAVKLYFTKCLDTGIVPSLLPFVTGHSRKLNSEGQNLVDSDLHAITAMLPRKQEDIQVINLQGCTLLTDKALEEFTEALFESKTTQLRQFNLKRCLGVGSATLSNVVRLLRDREAGFSTLRRLDLSGIHIGMRSHLPLCKAIQAHPTLTDVRLADTGLGDSITSKQCVDLILNSKSLQLLDLGWNCLSAEVFGHMGKRLAESTTLKTLIATNCSAATTASATSPAMYFLEYVGQCATLTHLDISLNRVDFRGALIMEDVFESHGSLRELIVSHNPFGVEGMRSLWRLMMRETSRLQHITSDGCSNGISIGDPVFLATNPGGRYRLDLSKPYDRSFLRMLYKSCDRLGLAPEAAFVEMAAQPIYRHPQKGLDGVWSVPSSGVLEVTFTLERMREGYLKDIDEQDFTNYLARFSSMMKLQPTVSRMVPFFAKWKSLIGFAHDQDWILQSVSKDITVTYPMIKYLCEICPPLACETICHLLPCLRGANQRHPTLLLVPSTQKALQVSDRVQKLLHLNLDNPTSHYRLELENPADAAIAERLLLLDRWETGLCKMQKCADTSQLGDGSHLRNLRWQHSPLNIKTVSHFHMPEQGLLECDYVTSKRPPANATRLDEDTFWNLVVAVQGNVCPAADQVLAIASISHQIYISSLQMRELLAVIADTQARLDLVVTLFLRLVDVHNDKLFRVRFEDPRDLHKLSVRLGHLVFFPFMQPEQAQFEFDYQFHDQRRAANLLVMLMVMEGTQNLRNAEYVLPDGTRDPLILGVPRSWEVFDKMPTGGIFRCRYLCAPEDHRFNKRRDWLETWARFPMSSLSEADVVWWVALHDISIEVIEYVSFLCATYGNVMAAFAEVDGSDHGGHGTGVLGFTKFESSMELTNCHLFDGPGQEEHLRVIFRYLDRNGNGQVSKKEWALLEPISREMHLSLRLFVQFLERRFGENLYAAWEWLTGDGNKQVVDVKQSTTGKRSTTKSSAVSEDEWTARFREARFFGPVRPIFLMLDAQKQGSITYENFEAVLQKTLAELALEPGEDECLGPLRPG